MRFASPGTRRAGARTTMVGLLVLGGLSALPPLAAQADPAPTAGGRPDVVAETTPPADGALITPEQALERDAAAAAKLAHVSIPEARRRLLVQQKVSNFVDSLPEDVRARTYAGGRLDFTASTPATLYFKGQVPEAVQARAIPEAKLAGGMKYSFEEMADRQNAMHAAVNDLGFSQVQSTFDLTTQRVELDVVQRPDRPDLRGQQLRDKLTARMAANRSAAATPAFTIKEHPAGTVLAAPSTGYGGSSMRSSGVFQCTSAFVVRRTSDQAEGVLTAAHCEGINQMDENNSLGGVVSTFTAPFVSEHIGVNGDIEWHTTTGHDDVPQFWDTVATRRAVTSRISSSGYLDGAYVCHYGRTSGTSCGSINNTNATINFPWAGCGGCTKTAYNMVGVSGAVSIGGDSGGPWYVLNQALGIHHGFNPVNLDQFFSRIQRAENQFGVTVQF
ncbi:hypothetical protein Sru01_51380 [Sphaerisporangium rufum]|uniref:Uncharacterized protein n=1 Tax=Sphaerisporangium rufum TaxID=1381558 RepID=A0A919V0K0_9ACTN|nr:S1 family peptidase [Sphaerisporangium rufum]GII80156.1 hypothetical protein Sru01_51380 [Sphaerisporangium rufum]